MTQAIAGVFTCASFVPRRRPACTSSRAVVPAGREWRCLALASAMRCRSGGAHWRAVDSHGGRVNSLGFSTVAPRQLSRIPRQLRGRRPRGSAGFCRPFSRAHVLEARRGKYGTGLFSLLRPFGLLIGKLVRVSRSALSTGQF